MEYSKEESPGDGEFEEMWKGCLGCAVIWVLVAVLFVAVIFPHIGG